MCASVCEFLRLYFKNNKRAAYICTHSIYFNVSFTIYPHPLATAASVIFHTFSRISLFKSFKYNKHSVKCNLLVTITHSSLSSFYTQPSRILTNQTLKMIVISHNYSLGDMLILEYKIENWQACKWLTSL